MKTQDIIRERLVSYRRDSGLTAKEVAVKGETT